MLRWCGLVRRAALLSAATFLAHCGSPPGPVPPGAIVSAKAAEVSWMARGLDTHDLLYVSNANGVVDVYRYWQHTLVGVLTNFVEPLGECSDGAGNVYITDRQTKDIYEYPHGGKEPIKFLSERGQRPEGCSVDPKTGNLAVAFNPGRYNYKAGNISIFLRGGGKPIVYTGPHDDDFTSCAYDGRGDLFTTSREGYDDQFTYFYYLPKNGKKLLQMDLQAPGVTGVGSNGWDFVQGVAWDGKYWVVEHANTLYRFTIDVKAQYVSSTQLTIGFAYAGSVALYRKDPAAQATEAVAGSTSNGSSGAVQYFNYPSGGSPIGDITKGVDLPFGAAISLRTK